MKTLARLFALRARSVARRAQRLSVRSLYSHTAPPSHTESIGIHRVRSVAFLHCAPLALREHTCVSLCLSHDYDFFRVLFRSRAPPPTSTPPSPPSPRASPPRDCPILRPRAGLPVSRACDSPFAMSFGATRRTRSTSTLRHVAGCCMSASRPFKRPSSLEPRFGPKSPCAAKSQYTRLLFAG